MAAVVSAHGAPAADSNNIVSFISPAANAKKKQPKRAKGRKPFVRVSYDSGSDADVESDDGGKKSGECAGVYARDGLKRRIRVTCM